MTNSRAKGARGELEAAALIKEYGFEAHRGQQFSGLEGRDVVHNIPNTHVEVKRVEAGSKTVYKWMAQAARDAHTGEAPVVFHRASKEKWLVIMSAEDYLEIMRELRQRRRWLVAAGATDEEVLNDHEC